MRHDKFVLRQLTVSTPSKYALQIGSTSHPEVTGQMGHIDLVGLSLTQ